MSCLLHLALVVDRHAVARLDEDGSHYAGDRRRDGDQPCQRVPDAESPPEAGDAGSDLGGRVTFDFDSTSMATGTGSKQKAAAWLRLVELLPTALGQPFP